MEIQRLLVANRGEIALRIMRSAQDLGLSTVAIHTAEDEAALHVRRADQSVLLGSRGVPGYLAQDEIVEIALKTNSRAVHPGYGFLSEQAEFAQSIEDAGLVFVGPTPEQLALLGDKVQARALAQRCGVPTVSATATLTEESMLADFVSSLPDDASIVLKAAAGGGGRGMRVVAPDGSVGEAWQQARSEAHAAFGDDRIYAETFISGARHVEVQIVGDGKGQVCHLWERDCSLQRRYQKLIEFAPAPSFPQSLRDELLNASESLARELNYRGVGTVEFLVDVSSGQFYFIEANARLQVEHTVTEEITGIDLVRAQLEIAMGATLSDLNLNVPPVVRGRAVQLRINAESIAQDGSVQAAGGQLLRYEPASGPGIRVDSAAHAGFVVHPNFDSLLAKLVVHTEQDNHQHLLKRAKRAAAEFEIEGSATLLPFLLAILNREEIATYEVSTRFVEDNAGILHTAAAGFVQDSEPHHSPAQERKAEFVTPEGQTATGAPMRGSVVRIDVAVGDSVRRGEVVALLEAMKMHHDVVAAESGEVTGIVVAVNDIVDEGEPMLMIAPDDNADDAVDAADVIDLSAERGDLNEVVDRHALGLDGNRPQAVAKRRKFNGRTARENVDAVCDAGSFIEYGALAIAAQRRRRSLEDLREKTPADGMIAGFGTVNADDFGDDAARCAVFAYDYTVLAGTQGHHNHKKKDRLFELAAEWETPIVFFTEGGGGRPGDVDTDDLFMSWLDIKTFATWPQLSGKAPRIAVNSGRCYAGNAVIFGCADITIATENSNIGLAGPAMIEGGGLGKYRPEDIGPIDVQTGNGVVDLACADEVEAAQLTRQVLGYFQGTVANWECTDQRLLRHLVPEDRLRVYDVRAVVEALADTNSMVELRPNYGSGMVTALIRIEGKPFGLIANDPRHLGGAIDSEGGEKGGRFLQLCDTFGLPVISLCDTPGYMVGPDSEKTAAVRRGSRLLLASANLQVPLFAVVIRKGYGLGAQAMTGGSFHQPFATLAWPTAEMGPMGLEGAVELGFSKELEATTSDRERQALFEKLVGRMYEKGKAVSVASTFEIDAVIDPAETRRWVIKAARAAGGDDRRRRGYVDVW